MAEGCTVVLDNGAYAAKVGLSSWDAPRVVPNCITKAKAERRRTFVAGELADCQDKSGLYYVNPFQRGFLTNWDIEHVIWDYMFSKNCLKINPESSHLVLTEPVFNFQCIQDALDEVIFEDYQFQSLLRHWGPIYSAYEFLHQSPEQAASRLCCLVVDIGHSFTHVLPFIQGKVISSASLRIDVGGKVMTNHLKEIISYRQLNMMDETYVVNQMKEDSCFVTADLKKDMATAKLRGKNNSIIGDYVLPDFNSLKRGYFLSRQSDREEKVDEQFQTVIMNNERFTVPELLFHPSDAGVDQMGVSEAIVHAVSRTPIALHPHFYGNIVVTGGSASFPGLQQRMQDEVRMLAPTEYDVLVTVPSDPTSYCWKAAAAFSQDQGHAQKYTVTKQEYDEAGHSVCHQKFRLESSL